MHYLDIVTWNEGSDKVDVWLNEKDYRKRSDYKKRTIAIIISLIAQYYGVNGKF